MQKRHLDRQLYFNEQSVSTEKHIVPYIIDTNLINLEPNSNLRVLEIGCGEGGNLEPFLKLGYECWGVELTETSYNNAVKFYSENPLNKKLHLINKNIYDTLPSDLGGTFDIIFLRDVIEHIPNQLRFMSHLKQFIAKNGVVFFGFPPIRMPFGGHQQVSRSKWVSHFPYIHLIPNPILKLFKVSQKDIDFITEIKSTGISIHQFDKILNQENYKVLKKTHWLINPNYETKFGLKPRKVQKAFQIPYFKDYYTTAMYYLVEKTE